MATALERAGGRNRFGPRHVILVVFALMTLFVAATREASMLDPKGFLRTRYAPLPWLMLLHGIPGALALFLGFPQFSERIRRKNIQLHKAMGWVYVISVFIAAPAAILVGLRLPTITLTPVNVMLPLLWMGTTAIAIYCARIGRIKEHREWMFRGYPFAMQFVVNRVILSIPAIQQTGEVGVATVVWTTMAIACFLPSFILAWQNMPKGRPAREPVAEPAG